MYSKKCCWLCSFSLFILLYFFSLPLIFTLLATSISHFLTVGIKFSRCSSNEIILLFYFVALALYRFFLLELRQPVACFLVFSVFFSLYSKFVDMKTISTFHVVFIDSLVVCTSQDAVGHAISHQKNIELYVGCIPVD